MSQMEKIAHGLAAARNRLSVLILSVPTRVAITSASLAWQLIEAAECDTDDSIRLALAYEGAMKLAQEALRRTFPSVSDISLDPAQSEMFEATQLNARYSFPPGSRNPTQYVHRDELSIKQAEVIARALRKRGENLIAHADILIAYVTRKHVGDAA